MSEYGPGIGLAADSPLAADLLLAVEPENMQAQSLRQLIERAVTRDGYIGAWRAPPRSVITLFSQLIGLSILSCGFGLAGGRAWNRKWLIKLVV